MKKIIGIAALVAMLSGCGQMVGILYVAENNKNK